MSYMLLILEKRDDRRNRGLEAGRAAYASMLRFADDLNARGLLKAANALRSDAHATRLTLQGGKSTVVDGPFTESKELIAGFWLIQVKSKDEAIAWAKRAPNPHGPGAETNIEIRQVFEAADFGS